MRRAKKSQSFFITSLVDLLFSYKVKKQKLDMIKLINLNKTQKDLGPIFPRESTYSPNQKKIGQKGYFKSRTGDVNIIIEISINIITKFAAFIQGGKLRQISYTEVFSPIPTFSWLSMKTSNIVFVNVQGNLFNHTI